jgi:purple acid phosphatase-like protein
MGTNRRVVSLLLAGSIALCGTRVGAYDTTGVNASPHNFSQPNLTEIKWKAAVSEYDQGTLRIEFNSISFNDTYLNTMLQNLLHVYNDGDCNVSSLPGGLEFYFSVIDQLTRTPPNLAGIRLDADPNAFPKFRRIFQNIDGGGDVGNNVYSNQAAAVPSPATPPVLEWHILRGNTVVNPSGNLKRNISCGWVTLSGTFREWFIDVTVNGVNYPVATYYYPDTYASTLNQWWPFVFHQEYFGACNNHLDQVKGDVRYYDFQVRSGAGAWIPITDWQLNYDYGGDCGAGVPTDLRHGLGTAMYNGVKTVVSRVGHANDVSLKRCSNENPSGQSCPANTLLSTATTGNEVKISNVVATGNTGSSTITWTTSRAADGLIRYGTTGNYGTDSSYASAATTSHSITISGLTAGQTYFFRIESIDSDGHMATSDHFLGTCTTSICEPTSASACTISANTVLTPGCTLDLTPWDVTVASGTGLLGSGSLTIKSHTLSMNGGITSTGGAGTTISLLTTSTDTIGTSGVISNSGGQVLLDGSSPFTSDGQINVGNGGVTVLAASGKDIALGNISAPGGTLTVGTAARPACTVYHNATITVGSASIAYANQIASSSSPITTSTASVTCRCADPQNCTSCATAPPAGTFGSTTPTFTYLAMPTCSGGCT